MVSNPTESDVRTRKFTVEQAIRGCGAGPRGCVLTGARSGRLQATRRAVPERYSTTGSRERAGGRLRRSRSDGLVADAQGPLRISDRTGLESNLDSSIAEARVREARFQRTMTASGLCLRSTSTVRIGTRGRARTPTRGRRSRVRRGLSGFRSSGITILPGSETPTPTIMIKPRGRGRERNRADCLV